MWEDLGRSYIYCFGARPLGSLQLPRAMQVLEQGLWSAASRAAGADGDAGLARRWRPELAAWCSRLAPQVRRGVLSKDRATVLIHRSEQSLSVFYPPFIRRTQWILIRRIDTPKWMDFTLISIEIQ